ncbi:hypothetical protein BH24ACT7_BH24ACT7_25630 [soil metagenome]
MVQTTGPHQRDRDQDHRAALATNELRAYDAITAACVLLGTTAAGLGLERAVEDLGHVLDVARGTRRPPGKPRCRLPADYRGVRS